MRRLLVVGLALVAVLALGVTFVASAGAAERGFLLLSETKGMTDSGSNAKDITTETAGKNSITCGKLSVLAISWTEPGPTHFNLAKDIDFHWTECKSGANECKTPGDVAGTLLLLMDMHLVNLLDKEAGKLVPGFFWLILNSALETRPVLVECGLLKIEVQGAPPGLIEPLNKKGEITLSEEVMDYDMQAKEKVVCDKENEKLCEELKEKHPFLMNFGAGFVASVMTSELLKRELNVDVLWDD
jgi:hypothetical protein